MFVTPLSPFAEPAETAKPHVPEPTSSSAYSDRPLCVHHKGNVTVVVYSSPTQEPKHLNHPILPSLHIMLVEEGKEVEGLTAILADYLGQKTSSVSASERPISTDGMPPTADAPPASGV